MFTDTAYQALLLINSTIAAITLIGTIWNAWQHNDTRLMLTEMQLNQRKEMNGRYLTLAQFKEYKDGLEKH